MVSPSLTSFLLVDHTYSKGEICLLTEGQPDSIVADIENMVRSYVDKVCVFFLF